ncbi:hypothetical protein COF68_05895 [Bacillus toyonensis]|uniref:hypothetical protein n=1 Tax=Bacillus toyonensis TaxID=155322 RepID=UPI000BFE5289|nr:hypothetical protein [Bacillus toyonensis]PHE64369.1 hypothetical protein COF68_05895 [Bacillus toyonensis]
MYNKKIKVIGVSVVVVGFLAFTGWKIYSQYQDNKAQEVRQEQLVKEAEEKDKLLQKIRDKELANSHQYKFNQQKREEVKDSKLDKDDLNLTKRFNRSEVEFHAKTILSINDEESRQKAIENLPLTKSASTRYFGKTDNVYYGGYKDVSVNVVFSGVDYSESDVNYSANIIAKVTSSNKATKQYEKQEKVETISLTINYKGTEIDSWSY